MKIAIFSGSFNPIHNGHLAIAREAIAQGAADELWFLVSPQNPLKKDFDLLPETDRLAMVKLAIENEPGMKASDYEFRLPRPTYTIKTLESLKANYPQHQFKLLIGGDNLAIFHKWFEYQRIIDEFGLIVYPRPGFNTEQLHKFTNTTVITAPLIDLSATEIREKFIKGESITGMVPEKVELFLQQHTKYYKNFPHFN
jgi:nicotinate-nucleotide adenylyltransferase